MRELIILSEKLGMPVEDIIKAIEQAVSKPKRKTYDNNAVNASLLFNWDAPYNEWRWITSSEALQESGQGIASREITTNFSLHVIGTRSVKRRRSNGRNLLLLPPVIENRD